MGEVEVQGEIISGTFLGHSYSCEGIFLSAPWSRQWSLLARAALIGGLQELMAKEEAQEGRDFSKDARTFFCLGVAGERGRTFSETDMLSKGEIL